GTEVDGDPNTVGIQAWYPANGTTSQLQSPHGIATDINGNIYIGQSSSGNVRRLDCAGNIDSASDFEITDGGNSFASDGRYIYFHSRPAQRLRRYDLCNPSASPDQVRLNGSDDSRNWGIKLLADGTIVIGSDFKSDATPNEVFIFNPSDSDWTSNASFNPIITESDGVLGNNGTNEYRLYDVLIDNNGNLFVNYEDRSNGNNVTGTIQKWEPDGNGGYTLVATIQDLNANDGQGFAEPGGMVLSRVSGMIYVVSQSSTEDCISILDPVSFTIRPTPAIGPVAGVSGKGIGINTECCPAIPNQIIDIVQCINSSSETLFLNDIYNCDGIVCDGEWTPSDTPSANVFVSCNQSLISNISSGCYSFSRSSDGTEPGAQCGAFSQTLNLEIIEIPDATITGPTVTCSDESITLMATTTSSNIKWQSSTTSATSGFVDIPGETGPNLITMVTEEVTYFRLMVVGASGGSGNCPGGSCELPSNTLTVNADIAPTITLPSPATNCHRQPIDLTTGVVIDPANLDANWSTTEPSEEGTFDNGTTLSSATTYTPSMADVNRGFVTLVLTTDDPDGICTPVMAAVTVEIARVDCGTYPWDGDND
ncbi:MAG: hypothetical protein AAGJ82_10230, partial [Bacteroidota bacterium]